MLGRLARLLGRKGLGYLPGPADERDVPFSALRLQQTSAALPESTSMRALWPRVLDQGATSSCVGHAIACAVGITEHRVLGMQREHPSPLMCYYNARAKVNQRDGGTRITDDGTFIRDGVAALFSLGCADAADVPTVASRVNTQPKISAYLRGHSRRGGRYHRITSFGGERTRDVRLALACGYPVVFGTMVGRSFLDNDGAHTIATPSPLDPIAGGHAMCAIGYSPAGFEIANSWGTAWRDGGFAWLTAEYIEWFQSMDFWLVRDWEGLRVS